MRKLGLECVAGVVSMCVVSAVATAAEPSAPVAEQIVVFHLSGPTSEAPPQFALFETESRKSMHDLLERFHKARKDDAVKAIVLTFEDPQFGMGQMQELRQAIADIRDAQKDVYAYMEEATAASYQLAIAATKVIMPPTAELPLTGIHVEHPYFKGLMDKIRVEADIEHIGSYKSAGEPFTRTGPSPEAEEMNRWLLQDLFDQMVQTIADSRQMTPEQVRELIDRGPFTAKEAVEAKLIDQTGYIEDFVRSLSKRYGANAKLVYNYGQKKANAMDMSNPFAIFKLFGEAAQKPKTSGKPAIGLIYVDGMILTGKTEGGLFGGSGMVGSTSLRRALDKARDEDNVKAVVLRVDSPGGSALASDIIWNATKELAAKKPLIVSMGDVAASGGYYVSVGAGTIFADPGTLTGSIGVIGGKIVTKGLWDWAGITWYEQNFGKNADLFNTDRKWDDRQREIIHKYMASVYGEFTDRVKAGRGPRIKKDIEELAGGRVYTGKQALALGLVDKLGGLHDALKFAAAAANVTDYDVRILPEPKNFLDLLVKNLMGESPDEEGVNLKLTAPRFGWTLAAPGVREMIPAVKAIDPQKAEMILRSLLRIELLAREPALLVTPTEITVR